MATAVRSRLESMVREYGIERTFEQFLNDYEEARSITARTYSERRNVVLTFLATVWAVQDQYVAISRTTYHIKGIVGDYPIPQYCIEYRDMAQE